MSAPNWLESLEEHIDSVFENDLTIDPVQGWKDILQMAKDNIDAMEGH